jgi:hypothetical protein
VSRDGAYARSGHDHTRPARALASTALNVRASQERLPWASFRERQVLTMTGWDDTTSNPVGRAAQRARLEQARATFTTTHVRASGPTYR